MSPDNVVTETEWASEGLVKVNTDNNKLTLAAKEEGYCSDSSDATEVTSNTGASPTEKAADTTAISSLTSTHDSFQAKATAMCTGSSKAMATSIKCGAENCHNLCPTSRCSRCHTAHYCSQTCQRAHWKTHKLHCRPRSPTTTPRRTGPTATRRATEPTMRPRRKQLPPRERNQRKAPPSNLVPRCKTNGSNDSSRPSRESIRNAKPVLVSSRKEPARISNSDEQSISARSKPSVIKVVNNMEEDFETFHEVDDDDRLDNDNGMSGYPSSGASCRSGDTTSITNSASFLTLTEERVRAHMRDYYEDFDSIFRLGKSSKAAWDAFFGQYFTPDIQWVRSSSNSLTGKELTEHFAKDIVGIRMKLVSINSIQILTMGLSAIVTFTADQKFLYRGNPNSDRTVITMVLNVVNGREIRIAHEHRCTGRPVPDDVNWD